MMVFKELCCAMATVYSRKWEFFGVVRTAAGGEVDILLIIVCYVDNIN